MSIRPIVSGPRWRFLAPDARAGHQRIVCEATGKLGATHAKIVGHLLSDDLRRKVLIVPPGKREPNPTLVSHGPARAAAWHVLTEGNHALADLYGFQKPAAARIARLLANLTGAPVKLLDNAALPRELRDHPRSYIAANPSRSVKARQARKSYRRAIGGSRRIARAVAAYQAAPRYSRAKQGYRAKYLTLQGSHAARFRRGAGISLSPNPKGRNAAGWVMTTVADGYGQVFISTRLTHDRRPDEMFTTDPAEAKVWRTRAEADAAARRAKGVWAFGWAWKVAPTSRRPNPKGLIERRYKSEKTFRTALAKFTASGELLDWYGDDYGWVIRLRRIVPSGRRTPNPRRRNPSWRLSGTLESVPDMIPARRGAGPPRRSRRVAVAALEPESEPITHGALALAPSAIAAPAAQLEGRGLAPGERVSVPYTGRMSYFGRPTKRTREQALVEGYVRRGDELMVQVRVHRGRQVEDHVFPERDVRRLPRSSRAVLSSRLPMIQARLERQVKGDPARAAAMLEHATQEFDAADAHAHEIYPQAGTEPSREYVNLRNRMRRLLEQIDILQRILTAMQPPLEGEADPWRVANGRRRRMLTNPGRHGGDYARAVKTFRMWHDYEPHRVTRVKAPRRIPRTMVRLGELHSVVYRSDKWAGGPDNPQGKQILYEHTTQRPRPVLATDPRGRDLFIVGGKMRVTADGLVH